MCDSLAHGISRWFNDTSLCESEYSKVLSFRYRRDPIFGFIYQVKFEASNKLFQTIPKKTKVTFFSLVEMYLYDLCLMIPSHKK